MEKGKCDMFGYAARAACRECDAVDEVQIDRERYGKWLSREAPVQELFSDLSASDREIILGDKSGMYLCPTCWEKVTDLEEDEWEK